MRKNQFVFFWVLSFCFPCFFIRCQTCSVLVDSVLARSNQHYWSFTPKSGIFGLTLAVAATSYLSRIVVSPSLREERILGLPSSWTVETTCIFVISRTMSMFFSSSFSRPLASHLLTMTANFSKYISKSRAKRQPLNTKRAGKGYYKGNGCRKEGSINSKGVINFFYWMVYRRCSGSSLYCFRDQGSDMRTLILWSSGRFIRDKSLCTELIMPDFTGCTMKPYIASGVKRGVREIVA